MGKSPAAKRSEQPGMQGGRRPTVLVPERARFPLRCGSGAVAVPDPAIRERSAVRCRLRPRQALSRHPGVVDVSVDPTEWVDERELFRAADDGDQDAPIVEEPDAPGAWPEDVDISFYASSSVTIPGMGSPGSGCGEWGPREFCSRCGELHFGPHRCEKRECPDCWTTWTARRSEAITRRIMAGRWAEDDGLDRRAVHAVASPPTGEVRTLSDISRYRRKAHDRMRERGVRGGVCVFHGFRPTDDTKEAFEAAKEANEEIQQRMKANRGIWHFIRETDRDWRSLVKWSPHFHYLGLCREFEADDGGDDWVVRRLSSMDPFRSLTDTDAYQSIASTVTYLLSHATFESEGSAKAITWFGSLHPSNFQAEEELSAGALSVIERMAAVVTDARLDREVEGESDGIDECENDDCDGRIRSIFEAGDFLADPTWCDQFDRETERRLSRAFKWAIGELRPPPGLQRPRDEQECREAFDAVLDLD